MEQLGDRELGAAVRAVIEGWVDWHDQVNAYERNDLLDTVVKGGRVVDGGQTGSDGSWEITDAESGEVLAAGVGIDSFDAAWKPEWVHVDRLGDAAYGATPEPDVNVPLPAGLIDALNGWALDDEDGVRELLGRPAHDS